MPALVIALFLATVTNRLIEAVVAPVKKKFPQNDFWWLIYVSWVVGGVLAWLSGVNLFTEYLPGELAGRVLTAIVVGGGANLIADLFQGQPKVSIFTASNAKPTPPLGHFAYATKDQTEKSRPG
jgi:hypothetical protein